MFGLRGKISALLALATFLNAPIAQAKTWNFDTGSPFGLGLVMGATQNPTSDFVEKPQETSTSFSHYFGFEPYLDFGNFIVRASGQLHNYPVFSGKGVDSRGAFSETSDVASLVVGAQLLLIPYVSETQTNRGFIKLGFAQGIARGENQRNYTSGSAFSEKFDARTRELLLGIGFEFFLVQNYSLQLETGYRQSEYEKSEYRGGTDLTGGTKSKGDTLLTTGGANKKFNVSGPYLSVGLNLNF